MGLVTLLRRHGIEVDEEMMVHIRGVVGTTLLPPGYVEEGNLSRADVYRIRAGKFLATRLPPQKWFDLTTRRQILKEVKDLVGEVLGSEVGPSRFLG